MSTVSINAGSMAARFKELQDRKDELQAQLKEVNKDIEEAEHQIGEYMAAESLDKLSANGITLYYKDKARARYEPEKWGELVAWAVRVGRTDLVQRRLSDAKVLELMDSGQEMPDGLTVEFYKSLEFRRSGS